MEFGTEQSRADRAIPEHQQYRAVSRAVLQRFKKRSNSLARGDDVKWPTSQLAIPTILWHS